MEQKESKFLKVSKTRNSNLELYRIIVMLLIVAHHYVVNSGVMEEMAKDPLSIKSVFFYIFGMWGKVGINCFVLITGYFMCKSKITIRKFLKLFLEVEFYNILIAAIFWLFGYHSLSFKDLCYVLVPMRMIGSNFTSCFMWFYLCIPFLTILVTNLNQIQHRLLVMLCMSIYTMAATLPGFEVTMNHVSWYSVLFFIASYIRFYGLLPNVSTKFWGGMSITFILLSVTAVLATIYIDSNWDKHIWAFASVSDANKFLAVSTSIPLFMFFKKMRIKQSKWINTIAASTFGVLCIHANSDTMRQWLWQDVVDCSQSYYRTDAYLYAVGFVLAIFIICILIDYIRIHTIEKWTFHVIDRLLERKLTKNIIYG